MILEILAKSKPHSHAKKWLNFLEALEILARNKAD